jgi:hypothetical protein
MQDAIGQELRVHYGPIPGLPHRMLVILAQMNDLEPGHERSRQVHNDRDRYKLKGMACLAASQVLQDPQDQVTASRLGNGYLKLAERAQATKKPR